MEGKNQGLKALILGASGASGRDLVHELISSPNWSEVTVIVRRVLDEWKKLPENQAEKLKIITSTNLDELADTKKWNFKGYNTVFCCLGTKVKEGKELFRKVDYTYPINGGQIAKENDIPHYSLVSSAGADKKSMFLYVRTKGETEEGLANLGLPYLSILRPGVILNRVNDDRFGEKCLKYIPFMPKIDIKDLAKVLRIEAEEIHFKRATDSQFSRKPVVVYENKALLEILKGKNSKL